MGRASSLLSFMLILGGCSDYDLIRPDDAKGNGVYDTAEPEGNWPDIEVSPMSLNFGPLPKDCLSDPQIVTIRNVGVDDLVVSDIRIGGSANTNFGLSASPPTLAPLEESVAALAPEAAGTLRGAGALCAGGAGRRGRPSRVWAQT